jgi:hypothetical protein
MGMMEEPVYLKKKIKIKRDTLGVSIGHFSELHAKLSS